MSPIDKEFGDDIQYCCYSFKSLGTLIVDDDTVSKLKHMYKIISFQEYETMNSIIEFNKK